MVSITLSVPEETKQRMEEFPEINWSEVARQAFLQKIRDLEFLREFKKESELTEQESIALGRRVNSALAKRYKKLGTSL